MRRRTFDVLMSTGGAIMAIVLFVAAGLGFWAYRFADENVTKELTAQQIFFPETDQLTDPRIEPFLSQYAGQQLVTGAQAEAYANHYIAVHLEDIAGGKTYAEMGALVRANPDDAELAAQRDTLFKGETLRGLLLNAFAFWKLGQLAKLGSFIALGLALAMAILAALGFHHARRVPEDVEIFARKVAPLAA